MMDRPAGRRQSDLLVCETDSLDPAADSEGSDASANAADGGAYRRRHRAVGLPRWVRAQ